MPYKPVGINENGRFAPRVEAALTDKFTDIAGEQGRKGSVALSKPPKTLVVFTFDDSPGTDWSVVRPILNARNVPGVFACISNSISKGTNLTWAQLRTMAAEGHEIADHSSTHAHLNTADLEAEITASKARFLANGVDVKGFVYPYGENDANVRQVTRENYEWGIGTGSASFTQPFHTFNMPRAGIGNTSVLANLTARVDTAIANKELLTFIIHSGYDLNEAAQGIFGQLIDYVKSKNVPVVTMTEALRQVGNLVDIGDYPSGDHTVVDGQGRLFSPNVASPVVFDDPSQTRSANALPSDFAAGKLTISQISSAGDDSWPAGDAVGVVYTDRLEMSYAAFTHQKYWAGSRMWTRRASTETAWGSWNEVGAANASYAGGAQIASPKAGLNSFTADATPESFAPDRIHFSGTNRGTVDGWPATGVGVVMTYVPHGGGGGAWHHQYYMNGTQTWVRQGANNTTWKPWTLLSALTIRGLENSGTGKTHSSFPIGVSITPNFTPAVGSGSPTGTAGMLVTYKSNPSDNNLGYDWQEYHDYNTNTYYRRTADTAGVWQTWKKVLTQDDRSHHRRGDRTTTNLAADFQLGTTINHVPDTTPGPTGGAGVLETHIVDTTFIAYSRQVWYQYNGDRVMTRGCNTDGTWRAWREITTTAVA